MYLYVELWNVTQKWMDLSKEERRNYMKKVQEGVSQMEQGGIENLGWAMNDEHTPYRSDYRYMAVWKMPSKEAAEEFEKGIQEANWHHYFSQENSRGKILPLNQALDFLVNLDENSTSLLE